jgi:peptide/nickel transport system substrate-binding protein
MTPFSLDALRDTATALTAEQDTLLKKFAIEYESVKYFREVVTGSGPYELEDWATGEYIRLKRKENWWGDQIDNRPLLLNAYPKEITYRIILDAAAAEAALKAGEIDLMAEVPAADFVSLQNDANWKDQFQFATPPLMQINYLELNTRDSILADKRIRQALAYSIDYEGIVQNVKGLASRTTGPIHRVNILIPLCLRSIRIS